MDTLQARSPALPPIALPLGYCTAGTSETMLSSINLKPLVPLWSLCRSGSKQQNGVLQQLHLLVSWAWVSVQSQGTWQCQTTSTLHALLWHF
jgi:hypothetical protein